MPEKTTEDKIKALLRQACAKMPILSKTALLLGIHVAERQYADWNEKSVEYYYARRILDDDTIANPLAGDAETLFGDLITGIIDGTVPRFCAIEFKARHKDIRSEFEKFLRTMSGIGKRPDKETTFAQWFSRENADLVAKPGSRHHYLIYGEQPASQSFGLRYGRYCQDSFQSLEKLGELAFCDVLDLTEYLAELAFARYRGPLPDDGGNSLVAAARAHVIGTLKTVLVCSEQGGCTSAEELLGVFGQWANESRAVRQNKMSAAAYASFKRIHKREPDATEIEDMGKTLARAVLAFEFFEVVEPASGALAMAVGASKPHRRTPRSPARANGTETETETGA